MFLIPQFSQYIIFILPVFADLDPEVQEHRGADEALDFFPGFLSGGFEDAAFFAYDDSFLGVPFT